MKRRTLATALTAAAVGGILAIPAAGVAGHGGALTIADLTGRAEVANGATNNRIVGDPNGSGEAYVFSTGGGVVCYVLEVEKIEPATAAHIHEAPAGRNGPVVVTIGAPTNGRSAGCVDTGDQDLAADITLREPENYYVNVHNAEFPGGALRGQLGN
jgi:hypothetical protein